MTAPCGAEAALCSLLSELTRARVASLGEAGEALPALLAALDAEFFPRDAATERWDLAAAKVRLFLPTRGCRRPFDVEAARAQRGEAEALLNALAQLLALVGAFNAREWTRAFRNRAR